MKNMIAFAVTIVVASFALVVRADEIRGKVVSIADGDTITILDANKAMYRIRLNGIDAPEKSQAFGNKSKEALAKLVHEKDVVIQSSGQDKYGRTLGTVYVGGENVNEEMVKKGMAWHYRQYSKDEKLSKLEADAKSNGTGLWADKTVTPPWEYRQAQKTDSTTATNKAAPVIPSTAPKTSPKPSTTSSDAENSISSASPSKPSKSRSGSYKESDAEKAYEKAKGVEVVHKKDGSTYERKARSK